MEYGKFSNDEGSDGYIREVIISRINYHFGYPRIHLISIWSSKNLK